MKNPQILNSRILILLIACATMLLASCDKIEEDNYIVYAGAAGEWYNGSGVADKSQRALIEKYTGVRCVNCPTADEAINAAIAHYGNQLIAVAIHDSSAFTKPIGETPRLSSPDGETMSQYFGISKAGQYPAAIISRTASATGWDVFTPTEGINSRVESIINNAATVAVAVDSAVVTNDTVNITVNIEFLQKVSGDLTLTLMLMEDSLVVTQRLHDGSDNENYVHNHVLRDVITDVWGADIKCDGEMGEKRVAMFKYVPEKAEWNLHKCHIVAFVSEKTSKHILNVAECHVR